MGSTGQAAILANYRQVLEQIEQSAGSVGRDPGLVRLVVVTKGHPVASVRQALDAGIRALGENYAEEGVVKKLALAGVNGVEWHMIGHVQSRKAPLVCQHFDWLHSLDSLKLAQRLDRFAAQFGRRIPLLLECNVSGEQSKFGWPAWDEAGWQALIPEIAQVAELENLELRGLMTMAPFFDGPEPARPYFQRLRRLQEYFRQHLPQARWDELSMGMSGDFTVAVQEGATMVRVGTAIMGPRPVA
jgi:pyridoxal phosphate enzyme (YggS family)